MRVFTCIDINVWFKCLGAKLQMYIFPTFLVYFFQVISKLSNKPILSQVRWSHFNSAKLHFEHSHNYDKNKAWKLLPFLLENRLPFFQNDNLNSILQIVLPLPILWVTAYDLFSQVLNLDILLQQPHFNYMATQAKVLNMGNTYSL